MMGNSRYLCHGPVCAMGFINMRNGIQLKIVFFLKFPTTEEAAYPHLLCQRVADIVLQHALKHGAVKAETMLDQLASTSSTSHRWILDMFLKEKRMKPLVSEFSGYLFPWSILHKHLKRVFSFDSS